MISVDLSAYCVLVTWFYYRYFTKFKTGQISIWHLKVAYVSLIPLGNPGVDERIILRWIFRNWDVGALTGLIWLKIGTGGGYL